MKKNEDVESNVVEDPNNQQTTVAEATIGYEDVTSKDQDRVKTSLSFDNSPGADESPKIESPDIATIPKILAEAMNRMWNVSEAHSLDNMDKFFKTLRGIRFQALQRRRAMHDALYTNLVSHDDRQTIFEDFRKGFNEIEEDFRYDVDCMSELHLRTQELRDRFWSMSENRKKDAEAVLRKFANDGSCTLSVHACQSQGVALVQVESNRFVAAVHVLLDLYYSTRKRTIKDVFVGSVEEAAPVPGAEHAHVTGSAVKGSKPKEPPTPKDKDKKATKKLGKDLCGDNVPRAPLGPMILGAELCELPEPDVKLEDDDDANVAAKGKAKPKPTTKGKKGSDERGVAADPLVPAVEKALEVADLWSKGAFALNRSSYGSEESYCSALEQVIWFEVERFKRTLAAIVQMVTDQCAWLTTKESEFISFLKASIQDRQLKEIAVTERLITLIQNTIDDFSPIREEWLIVSDALVIKQSRLVYPAQIPPPTPEVVDFFEDHLNDEQVAASQEMLRHMQLGKMILEQDLIDWLKRAESGIGPLAFCSSDDGKFIGLTWPRNWRGENLDLVVDNVLSLKSVAGTSETMGGVPIETVMARLQALGIGEYE